MLNIQDYRGIRRSIPPAAEAIWPLLEEGVRLNLSRPAPDLYSSGVVYRREARISGQTPDTFLPWWRVLPIGSGDCEDLSAWAASQYRRRGDTSARVGLVEFPAGGWHAVVLTSRRPRLPSDPAVWPVERGRYASARVYGGPDVGWDPAGWWVIDPSYSLGMRDPATPTLYHPDTLAGEREPRIAGPEESEPVNRRKLYLSLGIGALATAALVASLTRHPVDYTGPLPWRALWGKYAGFEPAIRRVARQLGTDPRFLLAVIRKESRFDPRAENPWGYVGLIQFGPAARTELGVTKEQVLAMTPAQQVELARRYYWPYRGKLNTLADLYMATFLPAYLGQSADAIIAARGSKRAKNNPSLDHDGDGQISYWEPGAAAAALLQEEEDRMRAAGELTAAPAPAVAGPDLAGLERMYLDRIDAAASVPHITAILAQLRAEPGTESLYGIIDRRIALFQRADYAGTLEDARTLARNIVRQLTLSTTYDPGVMQTLSHAATAVVTAPAELVRSAASAAESVAGWQGWNLWPLAALAAVGFYVWRRS